MSPRHAPLTLARRGHSGSLLSSPRVVWPVPDYRRSAFSARSPPYCQTPSPNGWPFQAISPPFHLGWPRGSSAPPPTLRRLSSPLTLKVQDRRPVSGGLDGVGFSWPLFLLPSDSQPNQHRTHHAHRTGK